MKRDWSRIWFGCEPLGGSDWGIVDVDAISVAINRAVDAGVACFDTADVYGLGLSESRLAEILGDRRSQVDIATKGGLYWGDSSEGGRPEIVKNSSPRHLERAIDASLERLNLGTIPIYFLHWPDEVTDLRSTFEFLASMVEKGKIRSLGCSNMTADQIAAAASVAQVKFAQVPVNILNGGPDSGVVKVCERNAISIVAYNVLANGLLTGKFNVASQFAEDDRRSRLPLFTGEPFRSALTRVDELKQQAALAGLTLAQYSIRWALERPGVTAAITGIKSVKQFEENVEVTPI